MATVRPEDHRPRAMTVKTISTHGITLKIDPTVFEDYDVMEYLYDIQHADEDSTLAFEIVPLLRKLFGAQYRSVKNALRDRKTGRIPPQELSGFLAEVMSEVNPN